MIVLTKKQRELFLTIKESVIDDLLKNNVDYVPVEAKGDLWILPEEVLADARFEKLKNELVKAGEFDKYEKREVDKSELKDFELEGVKVVK